MTSLRRLTSLSALVTFEAAARHMSFTRAAVELGVTQAAVSRQIRALEADLGTPLFRRGHRQVDLTRAGQLLSAAVTSGFDGIAETIARLRQLRSAEEVTVGATLAFSHFWLLPRLSRLRGVQPRVQMRLISQDERFDWRRDDVQIVVRYGPPLPGDRTVAAIRDRIFPVCSPDFLERHGHPADADALFRLPLIASDWIDPSWPSWTDWAEAAGLGRLKLRPALRFTHYIDTIHAAINGEGVAMGWDNLLSVPLSDGRLVRLGTLCVVPQEGYSVVVRDDHRLSPQAERVIRWIADEFARQVDHA